MPERYLPRQERTRLLIPEPSQKLIPLHVSSDFFGLVHGSFSEEGKKRSSIFHESEGREWLKSLAGTAGALQDHQKKDSNVVTRRGIVREIIATETYFGSVNGHKIPDFLVLTEDNASFNLAAYEVKSGTGGLLPQAERQISQSNTVKVLEHSTSIVRRINDSIHGKKLSIVNGAVLLPRSLRNMALLQPLDSFPKEDGRFVFPELKTYPYAVAQYSPAYNQQSLHLSNWRLGKNIQFFPSNTYPPDDVHEIKATAEAFGINPPLLDRKVFFSRKIVVNDQLARVSNLEFGSDITVGIPYTGWEVLQIVTNAAKVLQQKNLDIARPYSEFLTEFQSDTFFSFMKMLNSAQKRYSANGKNGGVIYVNGNKTQGDYI